MELLDVILSPEEHKSLAFSCADRLLLEFAEQIIDQRELAIAYPCLNCLGGLSLFLGYLSLGIERNPPGSALEPVLVYPGIPRIREAYTGLKIKIGDLMQTLEDLRIKSFERKGGAMLFPWEETIFKRLRTGKISPYDERPLYDFFPAALLESDGNPRLFAGREGFGRGDCIPPPLHFATRIQHISPFAYYRAAFIMHDAIETRAEKYRVYEGLQRISSKCTVHLFESPYSPTFRRMIRNGVKFWRIEQRDFPPDGDLFLSDDEILRVYGAQRRILNVPSPLKKEEFQIISENFKELRKMAGEDSRIGDVYSQTYSLYRLLITLPVPVEDYDAVANIFGYSLLSDRILDLEESARELGPGRAYALVDDSIRIFRSLVDRISKTPERAIALLAEVRKNASRNKRIGIVISNFVYELAIEHFLSRKLECELLDLHEKNIGPVHLSSLSSKDPFDVLVFFAYSGGRSLRWIMSGRASEIVVVATEMEQRDIKRDIDEGKKGTDTWKPRRTTDLMPPVEDLEPEDKMKITLGNTGANLPLLPLDDERFVLGVLDYSQSRRLEHGSSHSAPQKCKKIIFAERYAFLPVEGYVTILGGKGTVEKTVKDLKIGDTIIFVDAAQSRTIYELMIDEIRKSPEFTAIAEIILAWHRRLKLAFINSGMSFAHAHYELQKAGSTVVQGTVASWIRGNVMAPQDSDNLKRLFMVFGITDPYGIHSNRIDEAARKLRNVYRQYARAVNTFLVHIAGDDRTEVDALLEKHGLDIHSIRDAVVKEEIMEISSEIAEIPVSSVGRLYVL
jgi:hypothetical protein